MRKSRLHTHNTSQLTTQASAEQQTRKRRTAKAGNKYGNPIQLKSKILAAVVDPRTPRSAILVAESAGSVRRVTLDVWPFPLLTPDKSLS